MKKKILVQTIQIFITKLRSIILFDFEDLNENVFVKQFCKLGNWNNVDYGTQF